MNLKPLRDRIVVKRVEEETVTKGGIIIPDNAKEKPSEGTVMAVGPGRWMDSGNQGVMTVKIGDRVLFGKYTGMEVAINGEALIVMTEDDVLGVLQSD